MRATRRQVQESPTSLSDCSLTYDSPISAILQNKCTTCHSGSYAPMGVKLDSFSNVSAVTSKIVAQVTAGNMPPARSTPLTAAEASEIEKWVAKGAPENTSACQATSCSVRQPQLSALRLLSITEYENTLNDLFGPSVMASVQTLLDGFPQQSSSSGFETDGLAPTDVVGFLFNDVAEGIATFITGSPATLASFLPCFSATSDNTTCLTGFLQTFGTKVLRRPLSSNDSSLYLGLYSVGASHTPQDGLEMVISGLLQSPDFMYHLEIQGAPVAGSSNVFAISDYEIASRLSYRVTCTMPDSDLFAEASSGSLNNPDVFNAEVTRLFNDPRAEKCFGVFGREWLQLDGIPSFDYSAGFLNGLTTTALRDDMINEMIDFVKYVTFQIDGSYSDLMSSNMAFIGNRPQLAAVYGVPSSSGPVSIVGREGILKRGAALVQGQGNDLSIPPKRGAWVLRRLLCENINQPNPMQVDPSLIVPPTFDPTTTIRQEWTGATQNQPCASCHSVLNPVGYTMEEFDPIGRDRQGVQVDRDAMTGKVISQLPIDTQIEDWVPTPETPVINNVADLEGALVRSNAANECLAQNYFRFTEGRMEQGEDFCVIGDMQHKLSTQGILAMIKQRVLSPEFLLKTVSSP